MTKLLFFIGLVVLHNIASAAELEIVAGGFQDCNMFAVSRLKVDGKYRYRYSPSPRGTAIYKSFLKYAHHDQNPYIASCFTGVLGAENLYYLTSEDPKHIRKTSAEKYLGVVTDFIDNYKRDVIDGVKIIGHSHGGWLSLKIATELPLDVNVRVLTTIDPISYTTCNKKTMIERQLERLGMLIKWPQTYFKMLKQCRLDLIAEEGISKSKARKKCKKTFKQQGITLNVGQYVKKLYSDGNDSCLEAPIEFADHDLLQSVGYWTNYYQDKTFLLHSSSYQHASENIYKELGHNAIKKDKDIWKTFGAQ